MTEYRLIPHPDTPPIAVEFVQVSVQQSAHGLDLCYVVGCPADRLVVPIAMAPGRARDLWRTTCLELFVATGGSAYLEYNFSTSTQWAVYSLSDYRSGMKDVALEVSPRIVTSVEDDVLILAARIAPPLGGEAMVGLSAVIEESDGTKSYWALGHGDGPPDFHNADCFTAELAAPTGP